MSLPRLLAANIETVRLTESWHIAKDGDPAGLFLYERHYSAHVYKDRRIRKLFCGPGEKLVLLTTDCLALFVWRRFIDGCIDERTGNPQQGVNCAVFRNEGLGESSSLVLEAERPAWCRWPGKRLYTYVDPEEVKSGFPGWCFIRAGWKRCGTTRGGLYVFEKHPQVPRQRRERKAT